MTLDELKALAVSMLDRAYCPYSHFPVGAALECDDGTVYTGCNVENAVYPAGICAERNAIFHAVAEGRTHFRRIVIAGRSQDYCVPCGICRQVLNEFGGGKLRVIVGDPEGQNLQVRSLSELLPESFGPEDLGISL